MPWCGYGATGSFWWLWPVIGLVFIAAMMVFCFRGSGCMPWRHRSGELDELRREVRGLKDEVRKVTGQPS